MNDLQNNGPMLLTNSGMLLDAIAAFKTEMVVVANEHFGYMAESALLKSQGAEQNVGGLIRLEELARRIDNSTAQLDMLDAYIKAATGLVKWINGNAKSLNLPQLQPMVPMGVQAVLSAVGRNGVIDNGAALTAVEMWVNFYDVCQTLLIQV